MLEAGGRRCGLKRGTVLVPKKTQKHRLYVQTLSGREQGYLSFADDRMINGIVMDARMLPADVQEVLAARGMIPYAPALQEEDWWIMRSMELK